VRTRLLFLRTIRAALDRLAASQRRATCDDGVGSNRVFMEAGSVEAIVTALNDNEVRYLIVGGLAVVAQSI